MVWMQRGSIQFEPKLVREQDAIFDPISKRICRSNCANDNLSINIASFDKL